MIFAEKAGECARGVVVIYILSLFLAFLWLDLALGIFGDGMSGAF